eukprot:g15662.t1
MKMREPRQSPVCPTIRNIGLFVFLGFAWLRELLAAWGGDVCHLMEWSRDQEDPKSVPFCRWIALAQKTSENHKASAILNGYFKCKWIFQTC